MSHALEIRTEETPASADGFALCDLWMVPILLLALMFATFSRHLIKLKEMRRTRPMPKHWRDFWPELRTSEWAIRMLCFEGARQIILGGELDLRAISFDPEPPDDFQPSMPRSALAMHQRIEDLTRFYSDPERYVRRHADRIRERNGERDWNSDREPNPDSGIPIALPLAVAVAVPVALAIRGPP